MIFLLLWLSSVCSGQEDSLFKIRKDGKTGYIDHTGTVVIEPRFDEGDNFNEGLAPVRVGEDWGYIDTTGKFVITPRFFEANRFRQGVARVGVYYNNRKIIQNRVGEDRYIDKTGNFVKARRPKISLFLTNGNMPDSKTGYVDQNGKIVVAARFDGGHEFSEGLACVYSNDKAGFINTKGDIEIGFRFERCDDFSEGLAAVALNGKYGFIDRTGKFVIEPRFREAEPFSNGVSIAGMDEVPNDFIESGAYTAIDKTGRFLFKAGYGQIGSFRDGLAYVSLDGVWYLHGVAEKWGYINKRGEIVWKSF
jgi:hypothetical protein